jgi:hypothetical protein
MVLRGREARDETIAVDGSLHEAAKDTCVHRTNRSSQPREPSTARAVSVPLALHCMELAALEAICRELTT